MSDQGRQFEQDVRRIARLLWSDDAFAGALIADDRERDGVFETRDTINIVECTISTRRDKASDDAKKTSELVQKLRKSNTKHVNGWLVFANEPTADQRSVTARFSHSVRVLGFEQFRSLLFNGAEYLRCRHSYRFGSVADPITRAALTKVENYVPIDLHSEEKQQIVDQKEFASSVERGDALRIVLLGEYGSGKSVTLRNFFMRLRNLYLKNKIHVTPVYLNLRDHTGQREPVEALERHARSIAYPGNPGDLVRAWRGGLISVFLDGFDEMATTGWGGSLHKVRTHRYSGMTLIRKFVQESPENTSLIIAGRHNFFDNKNEMIASLGVERFEILRTNDFNDEQAGNYLKSIGVKMSLPEWMPRRPLLLAYLAARGFLTDSTTRESSDLSPSAGWDHLLDMICEREAQQDERLDPTTVRALIERLATLARATEDGRGRLDIITIQNAFRDIAGFPPDEAAQQFILRLPALGPTSLEDSSREFVDAQIADAARAGDVIRYIIDPYSDNSIFEGIACPLGEISVNIVSGKLSLQTIKPATFSNALCVAAKDENLSQLTMDLANIETRSPEVSCTEKIAIRGAVCEYLLLDDFSRSFSNILFEDCLFHTCEVSKDIHSDNIPKFKSCLFGVLDGYFGANDLPKNFVDCEVSSYSLANETSAQILHSDISEGLKILLTVLKKLFLQPGSGRQEAAFYRGAIDSRGARLVPEVLALLSKQKVAEKARYRGKDLWIPNRRESARVRKILTSPMISDDILVHEARLL
jgi:hypothetical protein